MRKLAVLAVLVGLTACKKKGPEGPVNKASDITIVSSSYAGVDKATAEPVINRTTTPLQACYKKGLVQNGEMGGVVNVQIKVNPKNDTYLVNILDGSKAPKIHDCVRKVYENAKVPGTGSSGGTVDVKIKFGK
jgi:hypothetical protein